MKSSRADKRFVETPKGRIAYLEAGHPDAPCVLLVHGIPTSSYLWKPVIPYLAERFRCVAPDLMGLGDTAVDNARTDYAMHSQAEMLDDFLDALGVGAVHLIAHDQGAAAGQILAVNRPKRVHSLVLTDCVCYDNWPVPAIARLQLAARLMPRAVDLACRSGLMQWWQNRSPMSAFRRGVHRPDGLAAESIDEYLRPLRGSAREREGFLRFLLAGSPKATRDLVPRLRELRTPTLILWAANDHYIPVRWGERLYRDIPGAQALRVIEGAGHFWQEENPAPFAAEILVFLSSWEQHLKDEARVSGAQPPIPSPAGRTGPARVVPCAQIVRNSGEAKA